MYGHKFSVSMDIEQMYAYSTNSTELEERQCGDEPM